MGLFLLRRGAEAFATLFVLTFVIFLLARLAGDPVPLILGKLRVVAAAAVCWRVRNYSHWY
jgi:ABC-type dipeptide/oligopeptide/nickel transport system permease component